MERVEIIAKKLGYVVTEDGQLLNPKGKRIGNRSGKYERTIIRKKKSREGVSLCTHRLQAFQKYGAKLFQEGIIVRHKNDIQFDNSWDNILIGTYSDNLMDVPENIRIKRARHASQFVPRKYDYDAIREFHKIDRSYKKTREKFEIKGDSQLSYILKRSEQMKKERENKHKKD